MNDNKAQPQKFEPVTVGDLRRNGHLLLLICANQPYCSGSETVEPGRFAFKDSDPVPDLGKRYKLTCERCGHVGFEARPVYPKASGTI